MRKSYITSLIGAVALTAMAAASASAVELKLAHYAAVTHPAHRASVMWAEGVAKRTNGEVTIKIFPHNALGDGNETLEQQIQGIVDLGLPTQPMLDKYGKSGDKPFAVVQLPFVFKSYQHAWRVLDGPFAKWVAPKFDKLGLVHMANWEYGFRNVTNNKHPVFSPDDMKGLKMRTPPEMQLQVCMESAGAVVTKINWAELPMALKQGVVDGQENPVSVIYHYKLYEVQPHLALTRHIYHCMMALASKKAMAKLTPDQRKILIEEAQKAGQWYRDENQKEEKSMIGKLQGVGMKITLPDRGAFKASMGYAYNKISDYAGKHNVDRFLKMAKDTP